MPASAAPSESNQRYRYLLAQGANRPFRRVRPAHADRHGLRPPARARRSRQSWRGHLIRSRICRRCSTGIPLEHVSTSMTINATAAILLALYVAVAKQQGANLARLAGTVQNDILKEYIARGTYIYPAAAGDAHRHRYFRVVPRAKFPTGTPSRFPATTSARPARPKCRKWPSRSRTPLRMSKRRSPPGWQVDEFAPQLSFFFNAHNELLMQIAKFRAARRLWARTMRDRFGARDPRSMMLRFHAQTAGSSLTAQQPENNIVRVALQCLAAVLGGCQSLHANALDEALALPTEEAALLALRTQQIIAHETGVANTVDPVAGSYAIEKLTDEIEAGAQEYIAQIDAHGRHAAGDRDGLRAAGNPEVRIRISAGRGARRASRRRRQPLPGGGERPSRRCESTRKSSATQVARLQALRARRDAAQRRRRARRKSSAARAATRISCRPFSPPSKPTLPWAKSPTRCAACLANTGNRLSFDCDAFGSLFSSRLCIFDEVALMLMAH